MPSKRFASLVALTVHYSTTTLVVHASRTLPGLSSTYKASSAVTLGELGKLLISLALALREVHQTRIASLEAAQTKHGLGLGMTPRMSLQAKNAASQRKPSPHLLHRRKRNFTDNSPKDYARSTSMDDRRSRDGTRESMEATNEADLPLLDDHPHFSDNRTSLWECVILVWMQFFSPGYWKLGIPAMLFTLQSNLQYLGLANLSVVAFQVTAQLKILTTALCSVLLLNRRLSIPQWLSLVVLMAGVAVIQLQTLAATSREGSGSISLPTPEFAKDSDDITITLPQMNQVVGLTAVILMCLSSGFASVYFEKCLKVPEKVKDNQQSSEEHHDQVVFDADAEETPQPGQVANGYAASPTPYTVKRQALAHETVQPGLWVRNVQLSTFALFISTIMFVFETNQEAFKAIGGQIISGSLWWWDSTDGIAPEQEVGKGITWRPATLLLSDFFAGFNAIAWFIVFLQITGGLIAALVIKHADNIAKNFATSLSILLSFFASVFLFDFNFTWSVLFGSMLVIGSTWLFNTSEALWSLAMSIVGRKDTAENSSYEMLSTQNGDARGNVQ